MDKFYGFEIKAKHKERQLIKEHMRTWIHNREYTETSKCELCHSTIPMKFHKNGYLMDNTKLYKTSRSKYKGLSKQHKNVGICSYNMKRDGRI